MTAAPPPGWYPDPSGASNQRYFDGTVWTDQLAPFCTHAGIQPIPASAPPAPINAPPAPVNREKKSPRTFVIIAVAGLVSALVTFFLIQLVYGVASRGSGGLFLEILGFALYVAWLVSVGAMLVGAVGAIARTVR